MYIVIAIRERLDNYLEKYYVSYDNDVANAPDECMNFDTKEEAEDWTKSEAAKEWTDCRFEIEKI